MSNKITVTKILILLSFTLVASPSAWAEAKGRAHIESTGAACKVEGRDQNGFTVPHVYEFGDLKIMVTEEASPDKPKGYDLENYFVMLDLKAPAGYLKRGVKLKIGQIFKDTICGSEVNVYLKSDSRIDVSAF